MSDFSSRRKNEEYTFATIGTESLYQECPGPSPSTERVAMLIAFNKPYGVLSAFAPDGSPHKTLAEFGLPKNIYPLGRLDADSEGLLLLSDEPSLNTRLLNPKHQHPRTYWSQVEGVPPTEELTRLSRGGIRLSDHTTLPCRAWSLDPQPVIPDRNPPVRFRKLIPTHWIGLTLVEGKNRQVRRMTAAIGHPTLRLIRVQIGDLPLQDLVPGEWKQLTAELRRLALKH